MRSRFAWFFLAILSGCEGALPPLAQHESAAKESSAEIAESKPDVLPGTIFAPEFTTIDGQTFQAGTAFFVSVPGQTNPIGLTAHHLFGKAGGLSRQIGALDLGYFVRAVNVYDIDAKRPRAAPAGTMLVLPNAGHAGETGTWSTDIAAFRAPSMFASRALALAPEGANVDETVWLVAEVAGGKSKGKRFHQARVVTSTDKEIEYRFEDATIDLRGTSGAPVVNKRGEVVGINLGGHADGKTLVGTGNPITSIRAQLTRGFAWETTIHLGGFFPLSGLEADYGKEAVQGIEMAISLVNNMGGLHGRNIESVYFDDLSEAGAASDSVLKLANTPGVLAILGDIGSARTMAGGIVANKLRVPLLTPGATYPQITGIGPFVFRACFNDANQAKAAARYLIQVRQRKKVGMLWTSDDLYSAELAQAFRQEAKRLGVTVVERAFLRDTVDFKNDLTELRKQKLDVIYAPVYYQTMRTIARNAEEMGLPGKTFFGSDSWTASALLDRPRALEGAEFTDHWAIDFPSTKNRAFVTAYRSSYKTDPSSISAMSFDAAMMMLVALKDATTETREAVRNALANLHDFEGLTGKIDMGPDREPEKDVLIVRIEGGQFRFATTVR